MRIIDDTTGIEVIDRERCFRLLQMHTFGRVAVACTDGPAIFPVNYTMDGDRVLFRTAAGTKFDAAVRGERVAFEIDATDPVYQTGWSVVLTGRALEVTDPVQMERISALPLRPWAQGERSHWVEVVPETVSGRRIVVYGSPDV